LVEPTMTETPTITPTVASAEVITETLPSEPTPTWTPQG
jgi:hypothetical protein